MARTQRTVDPSIYPITLSDMKAHLRVDTSDDDALITAYIAAATDWCENYTRRALVEQTWKLYLDNWPMTTDQRIYLPKGKVTSVASIVYANSASTTATYSGSTSGSPVGTDYQESLVSDVMPFVAPAYGGSWPSITSVVDPIVVTYTAGWSNTGSPETATVPEQLITAIRIKVADYYERRSSEDFRNVNHHAAERLAMPWMLPVWS